MKTNRDQGKWTPFKNADVARIFEAYPKDMRKKLLFLRQLVLDTAAETEGVGEIEETTKWGEPSYLAKGGSTIRMDWKSRNPTQYALYFLTRTVLCREGQDGRERPLPNPVG